MEALKPVLNLKIGFPEKAILGLENRFCHPRQISLLKTQSPNGELLHALGRFEHQIGKTGKMVVLGGFD